MTATFPDHTCATGQSGATESETGATAYIKPEPVTDAEREFLMPIANHLELLLEWTCERKAAAVTPSGQPVRSGQSQKPRPPAWGWRQVGNDLNRHSRRGRSADGEEDRQGLEAGIHPLTSPTGSSAVSTRRSTTSLSVTLLSTTRAPANNRDWSVGAANLGSDLGNSWATVENRHPYRAASLLK